MTIGKGLPSIKRITPSQVIVLGFLGLILLGTLLLMLPAARQDHAVTPFWDALFTATSATCVTGLVVHDTVTYWSIFGQAVILCLIQVGGMGVVTVAVLIGVLRGKKIGLRQRFIMQESIGAPQMAGIVRITGSIVKYMLILEGSGALILATRFCPKYGPLRGVWFSIFHSVSAFCNAGFDLMGEEGQYSSMTGWTADPVVNLVLMVLIIVGGIGFLTWSDFEQNHFKFHKYRLQTKLILVTSGILILAPFLFFFFYEFSLPRWDALSVGERFWGALFQAVTPRTAGFNTVNLARMSQPGLMVVILLMLVGGSPGSTAGGFKTTTLAALVLSTLSTLRHKDGIQAFGRRLEDTALSRATVLISLYAALALTGGALLSIFDGLPLLSALFETSSAIGTVGLTMGVTPGLSTASRLVLILLMYFGRVGGLTLIYAFAGATDTAHVRMPQERITIG